MTSPTHGPISQRPRTGGDGRLRLPADVTIEGDRLAGRLSDRTVDPFLPTTDRLLLAESFARLDASDRDSVVRWTLAHGAVDSARSGIALEASGRDDWVGRVRDEVVDRIGDLAREQSMVRWHLATLARLSETRSTTAWDPAWGRLVIETPDGLLVLGDDGPLGWHPSPGRSGRRGRDRRDGPPGTEGWPVVAARHLPRLTSTEDPSGILPEACRAMTATWDATVDLLAALLHPYLAMAMRRRFGLARHEEEIDGERRRVLTPTADGPWGSILAPISLQLLEGLRRVSEGRPGAAICRECGQPFIIIDARRRLFCNDRERARFTQRELRGRKAGMGP